MNDNELTKILSKMNIPSFRKEKFNLSNLTWLDKNLKSHNSDHPKFELANKEVKRRLKKKEYSS
ncbi:MAG: hypothetical protein ACOC1O_00020 [bacterium]